MKSKSIFSLIIVGVIGFIVGGLANHALQVDRKNLVSEVVTQSRTINDLFAEYGDVIVLSKQFQDIDAVGSVDELEDLKLAYKALLIRRIKAYKELSKRIRDEVNDARALDPLDEEVRKIEATIHQAL